MAPISYIACNEAPTGVDMNDFFGEQQEKPRADGSFGFSTEELEGVAKYVKSSHGENSYEYASALLKLGDAHMKQGRLSNAPAQENYEHALRIVSALNEASAEIALILNHLSWVKQSSGDTTGAIADLVEAFEIWSLLEADSRHISEEQMGRRLEDLTRMQRVADFESRRPPDL